MSIVLLSLSGCGEGANGLSRVTGTIALKGSPVGPGYIVFTPINSEGNSARIATASFGPDGKYELTTGGLNAGAQPGEYEIVITNQTKEEFLDEAPVLDATGAIPVKYSDPVRSGLKRTVTPEKGNVIDFDLEP